MDILVCNTTATMASSSKPPPELSCPNCDTPTDTVSCQANNPPGPSPSNSAVAQLHEFAGTRTCSLALLDKSGRSFQECVKICDDHVCTSELASLPHIPQSDLEIHGLLGQGGFATVHEAKYHDTLFALKHIRKRGNRGAKAEELVTAVFDLCNDAAILGKVGPHENIVTIRGVCQSSVSEAFQSDPYGWFFLEEKLQRETLANRLNMWRRELQQGMGHLNRLRYQHNLTSLMAPSQGAKAFHNLLSLQSFYDRLEGIAVGVANAMRYLHSEPYQLLIRDLKPQNIGFDSRGVVKLFDFGMATPVQDANTNEVAGTLRYLSPEALLGEPISLKSDVYSFGIILYELATLAKPFDQYFDKGQLVNAASFKERVVVGGWRPSLFHVPCPAAARLIRKCWDPSPDARPSFDVIHSNLQQILASRFKSGLPNATAAVVGVDYGNTQSQSGHQSSPPSSPATIPITTTSACPKNHGGFRGLFRTPLRLHFHKKREGSTVSVASTPPTSGTGTIQFVDSQ